MDEVAQLKQELARAETALHDLKSGRDSQSVTENRMRQLLELLPAGVILLDKQGRVAQANPAASELLGEPLQGESWMAVISRSFAPRSDDGHEISLKDGRRVSIVTRAMTDASGQLVLLTDQTETRKLQSRLSQYQRLSEMGRMMASLAHQIRTPLSAALLYASHLLKPELDSAQRLKFATKVKSRLGHIEQQISDMLIFARGETQLDNTLTGTELLQAIDEILDLPLAQYDADCDIANNAPDALLQCNKEVLLGAVLNIINNALQAAGKGQTLYIQLLLEDSWLLLRIIDQGPGMDAAILQQAQEPFFTTKSHGTGLGLAVARVVAKAHGGVFSLHSQSGVGTMAQFRLPCKKKG